MQEIRDFYDSIIEKSNGYNPKVFEPPGHESKIIRITIKHSRYKIAYGDIYEALSAIVEEDKLIPGYLKLGLSKIYPQYASYSVSYTHLDVYKRQV